MALSDSIHSGPERSSVCHIGPSTHCRENKGQGRRRQRGGNCVNLPYMLAYGKSASGILDTECNSALNETRVALVDLLTTYVRRHMRPDDESKGDSDDIA